MAVIPSPVLKILRWQHGRLILTGLLFTCLMAGLYVFQPRFIQFMDHKIYDVLFQSVHSTELSGAVAVVDLDEASLAEYGQWPWPRYRVALMLEKIRRAGAASIALDIVFAEEDNTSPAVLQRMLVHYRGGRFTFPTYSVRHVLKDRLEPGALDGKSSSSAPPRQG